MKFFTIGVYGSTGKVFFQKLIDNRIDTFCDIRQHRGVRGSKYAFVNSNGLQQKLNELDIKYGHILELAPTKTIRELQKEADARKGELKSERQELGQIFKIEYENKILRNFDFETFIEKLDEIGAGNVVFFCVEEIPEACHRSIVTESLHSKLGYSFKHL